MNIIIQNNIAFATIEDARYLAQWRTLYPDASHLVTVDGWMADVFGKSMEYLLALGGTAEARTAPPGADAALGRLGLSPAMLLDAMDMAKAQRDAGLYPMRGADGHQIFANGAWQWVPSEKKDWVFDRQGNRIQ